MKRSIYLLALWTVLLAVLAGCAPGSVGGSNTAVSNTPAGTSVGTPIGTSAPSGQITVPGVNIQTFAPGPNSLVNTPDAHGNIAGILLGLWHGILAPVTLVVSFFVPGVQMYEVHNDGSQYNLGFLFGVALIFVVLGVLGGSRRR